MTTIKTKKQRAAILLAIMLANGRSVMITKRGVELRRLKFQPLA